MWGGGAVGPVCPQIPIFFTTRPILLILYKLYMNMLRFESDFVW